MSFADAMARYGSDKPDLRVKLAFTELTDVMKTVDFKVFSGPANAKDGRVVALRVPKGASISRSEIDAYTQFVAIYGAKGLAWIKVNDVKAGREGLQSPIVKNLHDEAIAAILERTGAQDGDLIFFGADRAKIVNDAIGALRVKIGHSEFGKANGLFEAGWQPLWVLDFPIVRVRRGREALGGPASPVHLAQGWPRGSAGVRSGRLHRQGLRPGAQRLGNGRGLGAYPPRGRAEQGVPGAGHRAGRGRGQVWLPAVVAALRGAPARWPGLRSGPDGDADDRRRIHPRRDRLPQNPAREDLLTQAPSPVDEKQLRELHIRLRNPVVAQPDAAQDSTS